MLCRTCKLSAAGACNAMRGEQAERRAPPAHLHLDRAAAGTPHQLPAAVKLGWVAGDEAHVALRVCGGGRGGRLRVCAFGPLRRRGPQRGVGARQLLSRSLGPPRSLACGCQSWLATTAARARRAAAISRFSTGHRRRAPGTGTGPAGCSSMKSSW